MTEGSQDKYDGVADGIPTSISPGTSGCATFAGGENVTQNVTNSSVNVVAGDQVNIHKVVYNIIISEGKARPANQEQQLAALQRYRNKGEVKKYFGTRGNAVGQMTGPHGICSTSCDDIVVADFHNSRIQIFDVNGRVQENFGSKGKAKGQFDGVADVCVTSSGNIVASDYRNHRIQIFDEHGRFVREFGRRGSGNGELACPMGVATDGKGLINVCDAGNHRVQVFSEEGTFVRKFGSGQLKSAQYLSVTPDGRVVVSDPSNHRVVVCDSQDGHHLLQVGTNESELNHPRGVATDDHGNMIAVDYNEHRVKVFTSDGAFVTCFGSEGSELGQMKKPVGVCVLSDGRIAVADTGNSRVQIF